jgi:hypothetical protein
VKGKKMGNGLRIGWQTQLIKEFAQGVIGVMHCEYLV